MTDLSDEEIDAICADGLKELKRGLNPGLMKWQSDRRCANEEIKDDRKIFEQSHEYMQLRVLTLKANTEKRSALIRHHAAKRRSIKKQRCPSWADLNAIKAIYQKAQDISRRTGIPHHVDHVIPLSGKFVSGLHVHFNLEILTATENIKKGNYHEAENG